MPDRHDICRNCPHERVEHGSEAGEGCTVIVDARRIGDERCRCERFAETGRDTQAANAILAKYHKGNATPKAEFAGLMSIAGFASFDEACELYDAALIEGGADFGPSPVNKPPPAWSSHDCEANGCTTPDAVAVCSHCGSLFSEGGGSVAVETFDGSAPEVGAPRLCTSCYQAVLGLVGGFLFPPVIPEAPR